MNRRHLASSVAASFLLMAIAIAASPIVVPFIEAILDGNPLGAPLVEQWRGVVSDYPATLAAMFSTPHLKITALMLAALAIMSAVATVAGHIRLALERRTDDAAPMENTIVYRSKLRALAHVRTWNANTTPRQPRLALGTIVGKQVLLGGGHSAIISSTGGGKSRTAAIPTIACNAKLGVNFVVADPSQELYAFLKPYLDANGYEVYCLDFENGARGDSVDFLGTIKDAIARADMTTAQKRAESLGTMLSPSIGMGDNAIFPQVAAQVIAAIAFNICADQEVPDAMKSMASVAETAIALTQNDPEELKGWIRGYGEDSMGVMLCASFLGAEGKELSSFVVNLHEALSPYATASMRHLTNPVSKALRIGDIPKNEGKPKAIFIRTLNPGDKGNRLVTLLLQQLWSETERQGAYRDAVRPLYCVLDEYASIAKAGDWGVEACVTKSRKYGWRNVFIVQNIEALAPGNEPQMRTILGNCTTIAFYSTTDEKTAEYIGSLFGQKSVLLKNTGKSSRSEELLSESSSYTEQSVPNFTVGQLFDRDPIKDGVLVMVKEIGDKWHSGRFVIPVKDVTKTVVGRLIGTVGTREREAQVSAVAQRELDEKAAARTNEAIQTWTPAKKARDNASASGRIGDGKLKIKIRLNPSGEERGKTEEELFGF